MNPLTRVFLCPEIIPPPTAEEIIAVAAAKKQALISEANMVIAPLKDALDGDYIDDADKPRLSAWQKYRYALTKVDTAKPVWPTKPEQETLIEVLRPQ